MASERYSEGQAGGGRVPEPELAAGASARDRQQVSLRRTFSALQHPNYRLWFGGQLVSLVGSWMQITAQSYLVFQLTGSPAYLGYVGFANGAPSWVFMLYGGVVADRIPRRRLLVITQCVMMVLAFGLAALVFSGLIQPWHIVALTFLLGVTNAFDTPARQAFILELVEREDLANAIALNSSMFNSGTAVGPAIAGVIYALVGPAWCFTVNGVSFIAVIAALLLMRLKSVPVTPRRTSALQELREGLRFVAGHAVIRMLVANIAVIALLGFGVITLMPAWAVEVLGGDATTNGLLLSARGTGALLAALTIASLGHLRVKGRLLVFASTALPLTIIAFSVVRWLPLSLLALFAVGLAIMFGTNLTNVLIQTNVPDHLRGRVMSIYALAFFGIFPIGSLLAGGLASAWGEPVTVAVFGLALLGFAAVVWARMSALRMLE